MFRFSVNFLTCCGIFQELKLFSKPRESFRGFLGRDNSRPRKLLKKAFSATAMDLREAGSFRSNDSASAAPHRSYCPSERSTAATEPPPTVDSSNYFTALPVVEEPILRTGAWMQEAEFCSNDLLSMGWKENQQSPQVQLDLVLHVPPPDVRDCVHRADAIGQQRSASKWRRLPKVASDALDAPIVLDTDQS
jgi:hypothetical protein